MDSFAFAVAVLCCTFAVVFSEAPYITGPQQRDVEQHTEIKLECVLPSTGARDVSWFRDSTQLKAGAETTIEAAVDQHKSVLTIAEAEKSDSGTYKCQSPDGVPSNTTQITVTESKHLLTAKERLVTLVHGSTLTLSCEGDIHTHVDWYKDQTKIETGGDFAVSTSDDEGKHIRTSTLTIKQSKASHEGRYRCQNEHHDEDRAVITVRAPGTGGQTCVEFSFVALLIGLMISLRLHL